MGAVHVFDDQRDFSNYSSVQSSTLSSNAVPPTEDGSRDVSCIGTGSVGFAASMSASRTGEAIGNSGDDEHSASMISPHEAHPKPVGSARPLRYGGVQPEDEALRSTL